MRFAVPKSFVLLLVALFGLVSLSVPAGLSHTAKHDAPSRQPADASNEAKGSEKNFESGFELDVLFSVLLAGEEPAAAVPLARLAQSDAVILCDTSVDRPDHSRAPPAYCC